MSLRHRVPLLLALAPVPLIAQQQPEDPPGAAAVVSAPLPRGQELLLPNGLRMVLLERHRQPVISVALSVPAGSAFDPAGREGTADLLASLLTRGAGRRDAEAVTEAVESVGGSLSAVADPDQLTLQVDVVARHAPLAFELLADALLRPTLDSAELGAQRERTASSLAEGLASVGTIAARVFLIAAYRSSPYARRPTPQSVMAIARDDLLAFHRARVRPAGALLVIAGDLALADARRLATQWFGGWKGLRPATLSAPAPTPAPPGIILVHVGGARAANVILGSSTFAGSDSGYYAAAVLNRILGEGRSGRLVRALGTQHGWTRSAGTSFLRTLRLGLFQATAAVPAEAADSALRAMYAEIERMRTDLVPAKELERAREAVAGTFALQLQTTSQLASAVTEARVLGLPTAYVSGYRPRVLAVSAVQVRATARRVLPSRGLVTVVVGDASRLHAPLSAIAPVRIFAQDGTPLTAEQVQPAAAQLRLDPSRPLWQADSLVIVAQGQTVGLQVTGLARAGDSLTYVEQTTLGTVLSQTTTLVFDTSGGMRRLEQIGKAREQDTRIQLRYGPERVQGTADLATSDGPRHVDIDTPVPAGIVDDNGVQALLPLLRWSLNSRWSFPVFASGENRIRVLTLTAADITRVTVPAGEFECYRADLEGGPQRVSFFVTTTVPHRVVRVELANSPIVFMAISP